MVEKSIEAKTEILKNVDDGLGLKFWSIYGRIFVNLQPIDYIGVVFWLLANFVYALKICILINNHFILEKKKITFKDL